MGKLYQKLFVFLFTVFAAAFFLNGHVFADNYRTSLCDGNNNGVSDCPAGSACVNYLGTFKCTDPSSQCNVNCSNLPGNYICAQTNTGYGCLQGSLVTQSDVANGSDLDPDEEGQQTSFRCDPQRAGACPGEGSYCGNCQVESGATVCYCVSSEGELLTRTVGSGGADGGNRTSPIGDDSLVMSLFSGAEENPEALGSLTGILYRIILPVGILAGILLVIVAGYGLMTAQGDPQKAMEAKEQLTSAIIGLLFVLLGAGLLRAIISTLIQGDSSGL